MSIPTILLVFHHRPMASGIFMRHAFRQAGCRVVTIGPQSTEVYGIDGWEDYEPPTITSPLIKEDEPMSCMEILALAANVGVRPDLLVMFDQYDKFYLYGESPIPLIWLAGENWNLEHRARADRRKADAEYYWIRHEQDAPSPPLAVAKDGKEAEWLWFGADPFVHPRLPHIPRDKFIVQIGTHYEPRPTIWNQIRELLDGAPSVSTETYSKSVQESALTLFGRAPSYREMAEVYNRGRFAISCSTSDFVPMRICEAFAMGSVLLSDDVPSMRAAFGAPFPENPEGIWVKHDRTAQGVVEAARAAAGTTYYHDVLGKPVGETAETGIRRRATEFVYSQGLYYHHAVRICRRVGIQGIGRMVADY